MRTRVHTCTRQTQETITVASIWRVLPLGFTECPHVLPSSPITTRGTGAQTGHGTGPRMPAERGAELGPEAPLSGSGAHALYHRAACLPLWFNHLTSRGETEAWWRRWGLDQGHPASLGAAPDSVTLPTEARLVLPCPSLPPLTPSLHPSPPATDPARARASPHSTAVGLEKRSSFLRPHGLARGSR